MAAPGEEFGDDLFNVFDQESVPCIPEKTTTESKKDEEPVSKNSEAADVGEKRNLDEDAKFENETSSMTPKKKIKSAIDTGEDLDPNEVLPRIQVHKVDTVEACIHEVAIPPDSEYKPLIAPTRKPAKEYPFILDPFQKEALLCIENNESVLVSAHTSAGKTVVAEYAVASSLRDKQRVIYTTPIKALSNQKYREMFEEFQDVGLMTGDVTINPSASCLIMTTEILRSMLYRGSEIMREVAWVVFDEIHYMRDKERGVVWEETIILLPDNVHYVFLSATIPNATQFAEWICHLHHHPCHVVYTEYRPVPLQHYVFPAGGDGLHLVVDEKGAFREENFNTAMSVLKDSQGDPKTGKKPATKGETTCFKIVKMIMERNMAPVIIFSFSRKDCEGYALQMSKLDFNTHEEKQLVQEVFNNAMDALSDDDKQLPQVQNLLPLLKKGVGIHHSGLLPILKETIEILFAEGLLKALFATETFAMGLNMPARTVMFTSARKFDGKAFRWVSSGEYIQMSGRAGRRGLDEQGIVILMVDEKMSPGAAKQIIKGQPAELNSAFHLTYNMVLNLLRVEEINPEYMLEKSFYQFQNYSAIPALFERVKNLEKDYQDLQIPQEDQIGTYHKIRQQLDNLGRELQSYITKPQYILPFLQPGRMVKVKNGEDDFDWGIIVNFQKKANQKDDPEAGRTEPTYIAEVLVNLSKETATQNSVNLVKPCPVGQKGEMQVIPVMLHIISAISSVRLYYPKDLRSLDSRQSVLKSIQEVKKRFKDGVPLLDPIEDMGIKEKSLKDCVKKIEAFEHRMYSHPLHNDPKLEELFNLFSRKVKIGAEIKAAKADLKKKRSLLHMDDLKCMKRVLRRMGYCTSADVIETKGRIACEISSADELLLTELLFNGVFNDLNPAQTCSLMSCLVFQEKAKEMPKLSDQLSGALRVMQDTARRIARVSTEAKLTIDEQQYVEGFKPFLMDVVHAWCNGSTFSQILKMTSVFEGSIIRCMRRLEETLRQMMQAAKAIGNTELEIKFAEACTKLKRDIAFAASLYL